MSISKQSQELPKSVKVGPFTYSVLDWDTHEANDRTRFGEHSGDLQVIRVDTSYGHQRSACTLLHEILHAIFSVWNMEHTDSEERIVKSLANGISTVWADNPEVFAWIHRGLTTKDVRAMR